MGRPLPKTQYLGAPSRHSPSTDKPGNGNISIHQGVTGTILAATCVKKVLVMCLYAPCRLRICTQRWTIRTAMYSYQQGRMNRKTFVAIRPLSFQMRKGHTYTVATHRCRWHRWQMKKIFNQKNFNNFVGTPLDSRVNIYKHFCLQVHFKVYATGVVDTGGQPWAANISANFRQNSKRPYWYTQGLGGNWFMKKTSS